MMIAALKGQPEIAVGAIIGSNISNIALILGLSALICPLIAKLAFLKTPRQKAYFRKQNNSI
jgi:cation:H+ antiporter